MEKDGSSGSAEAGQGRPLVPLTGTDHDVPYPAGCRRPDNPARLPRPKHTHDSPPVIGLAQPPWVRFPNERNQGKRGARTLR